jgi:hypothetical protein
MLQQRGISYIKMLKNVGFLAHVHHFSIIKEKWFEMEKMSRRKDTSDRTNAVAKLVGFLNKMHHNISLSGNITAIFLFR